MDKEALEALQKFQDSGLGEKLGLSVTVQVYIFRKWWVDETKPDKIRWFFLDGISQDTNGKPFFVRAWWPIPLDDQALFEELDKIQMDSFLSLTSVSCTWESKEGFHLDDGEQGNMEGGPSVCLGMKTSTLKKL